MIMRMSEWEKIRHLFDEHEKAQLNLAVTGEAICPRGLIIDPGKLSPALRAKLEGARYSVAGA